MSARAYLDKKVRDDKDFNPFNQISINLFNRLVQRHATSTGAENVPIFRSDVRSEKS